MNPSWFVQSTSPYCFLYHLNEEVVIAAAQEPFGLLTPCCVAPPADSGVVEVAYEDKGLQT